MESDSELNEDALRNLTEEYKSLVRASTGRDFPRDPVVQLWGAIEAVCKSWTLKKAVDYRRRVLPRLLLRRLPNAAANGSGQAAFWLRLLIVTT